MSDHADQNGYSRTNPQALAVAERFVSLAETLVDEFDLVELLDRLVSSSVDLLEVRAAGILLRNSDQSLDVVASTDEQSHMLEVYQLQSHAGPCAEVVRTGEALVITTPGELRARWPAFAAAVEGTGYDAIYALPMRLHDETIGALNIFDAGRAPLSESDRRLAQALADVATIGIFQNRTRMRAEVLATQLQHALDSRIRLEQAKGVIAEHGGVDMAAAFEAIRSFARAHRIKLGQVAQGLVERRLDPSEVIPERGSTH